jgi:hypothetical protein
MNVQPAPTNRLEAAADFADRAIEKLDRVKDRAMAALDANDSFAARVVKAGLEVPKAVGWGALGGVAIVALPSVLAPPVAPFFLPFTPVAAVWGASIGFMHGTANAVGRLVQGNDFRSTFPPQ